MIKIGLLPLYIALYDQSSPELRPRLERFYEQTAQALEAQGFALLRSSFCRVEGEFEQAIKTFEQAGAQCLVTMHMAYSPSLESSRALVQTPLPIVVLDITDTCEFGPGQSPEHIMYCHGIHGVMDMCSLLLQNGKRFAIAAGHPDYSDVMERAAGFVRAAVAAKALHGSKVGTIGGLFKGMGDFAVTDAALQERFGVEIISAEAKVLSDLTKAITSEEIKAEISSDCAAFKPVGEISREAHMRTAREGLAIREWIEQEHLLAFSANFSMIGPQTGLTAMPFLEASKAMARGTGYAGEGDVLTAAFCGALLQGFEGTSFIEIFCPDWQGNRLFLSHMGEINLNLTSAAPEMLEKDFIFGDSENPVVCYGCYQSGEAMFVNICRGSEDFRLVTSPVTMEAETGSNFAGSIRGWMQPRMSIAAFLEAHSRAGATHHSILVYGATAEQLRFFGELLELEVIEL